MMRFTQYEEDDPLAFQSSVSTDQVQNFMLRCCARVLVVVLYEPPGGRNAHGGIPMRLACSAVARSMPGTKSRGSLPALFMWLSSVCNDSVFSHGRAPVNIS